MVYNLSEAADLLGIDGDDEEKKRREVLRMAASGKIFLSTYYEGLYFSGDFSADDRNVLPFKGYAFLPPEIAGIFLTYDIHNSIDRLIFDDGRAHDLAYKKTTKAVENRNRWGGEYDRPFDSYDRTEIVKKNISCSINVFAVEEREIERWHSEQNPATPDYLPAAFGKKIQSWKEIAKYLECSEFIAKGLCKDRRWKNQSIIHGGNIPGGVWAWSKALDNIKEHPVGAKRKKEITAKKNKKTNNSL
jgi:hypothetical protein